MSSDDAACRAIAAKAAPFGRIDALANNAGITKFAPRMAISMRSRARLLRLFAVNVVGPFQMLRAARPLLEACERASVLMVSSIAGVTGIGSSVAYAASKGALNTMTLSLARVLGAENPHQRALPRLHRHALAREADAGRGRRAHARRHEALTPLQAASTAEDIADAGLFFLSDAARHVTGETLLVDAGLHLGFASLVAR